MGFPYRHLIIALSLILAATACSSPDMDGTTKENVQSKKAREPAEDAEGMLQEGPGILAGGRFSEEKAMKELEKIPEGLSAKEAYMELLHLFAEDYRPIVKEIDEFDTNPYVTSGQPGAPESPGKVEEKKLNVAILLDASGSMAGQVKGGQKMEVAKAAVKRYASSLPNEARVSLRVYGHKGSNRQIDKSLSCQSTDEVYPLSAYQEKKFNQGLEQFQPTGWTPIALAMQEAKKDLEQQQEENTENVIYIVSDGEETCGGDPVKVAKELNQSDIKAVVNIIGFDVDDKGQRELEAAAKAGGGEYFSAQDEQDLRKYLDEQNMNLRSEWFGWTYGNLNEVSLQYAHQSDKFRKVLSPKGRLSKTAIHEFRQMEQGAKVMREKGKLQDEQYEKLKDGIFQRKEILQSYAEERLEELERELKENRDRLQEYIRKKGNNERDSLR
ncbi:VWA domain-containing protein [Kroppenstedtia eburnea]|uniref:VWA domain-containing protein n=1 Tax=Kroppenstedtia eburnea TaxID=714067 RepID=UPI00363C74C6